MSDALIKYDNKIIGSSNSALKLSNLSPENIKKDVSIGGIVGSYTGKGSVGNFSNRSFFVSDGTILPGNSYYATIVFTNVTNIPVNIEIVTTQNYANSNQIRVIMAGLNDNGSIKSNTVRLISQGFMELSSGLSSVYDATNQTLSLTITDTSYYFMVNSSNKLNVRYNFIY